MYNVGLIGLGKMGQIRLDQIEKLQLAKNIYIYDPRLNISKYNHVLSAEDIFNNPEIDLIFICTPNFLNMEMTISALKNGKHVFCEKPPALTANEVIKIQKYETESKKVLMYGFNHRHHSSIEKMKSLIKTNKYGKILWMRGRYGKSVNEDFLNDWRSKKNLSGGGILIDQGIHMIDLFLYLGGHFDKVHAAVSNLFWKLDVEDNVFATLENTKTGLVASLHSTMTQWRHIFSLEVFLEKGSMILNGLKTSSGTYGDEILSISTNKSVSPVVEWKDEEKFEYYENDSWLKETKEFILSIQEKRRPKIGSSSDALNVMRIVDKVYSFSN